MTTLNNTLKNDRYYNIAEVAEIVGVEPYVLRYWESKFKSYLNIKRQGNRRSYTVDNINNIKKIKSLLYDDGFTIDGAKQLLLKQNKDQQEAKVETKNNHEKLTAEPSGYNNDTKKLYIEVISELKDILDYLMFS